MRLRDPLPVLCQNPEIYDRSKVSADCFDALHCLRMLRKVDRLREAAEQELFPGAAQLIQVHRGRLCFMELSDASGTGDDGLRGIIVLPTRFYFGVQVDEVLLHSTHLHVFYTIVTQHAAADVSCSAWLFVRRARRVILGTAKDVYFGPFNSPRHSQRSQRR